MRLANREKKAKCLERRARPPPGSASGKNFQGEEIVVLESEPTDQRLPVDIMEKGVLPGKEGGREEVL